MKIEVPKDESVRLGRVGLIALAGFVIGILWPRLAGMQLVPRAPVEDDPRPAALASAAPKPAAPEAAPPDATELGVIEADRVKIGEMVVTSCRGAKEQGECDAVAFDGLARTRLSTLAACPAGLGSTGVLSIGFDLDFDKNAVSNIRSGQSTSLDDAIASKLIECVSKEFKTATLAGVKHEHTTYTVFYKVEFLPEKNPAEQAGSASQGSEGVVDASGRATVGWNVALIRKEPRDGEVVARVLSGTNVVVTGREGDWYRVKYDGKGNEGWVYRSAIGL